MAPPSLNSPPGHTHKNTSSNCILTSCMNTSIPPPPLFYVIHHLLPYLPPKIQFYFFPPLFMSHNTHCHIHPFKQFSLVMSVVYQLRKIYGSNCPGYRLLIVVEFQWLRYRSITSSSISHIHVQNMYSQVLCSCTYNITHTSTYIHTT